MRILHLDTGKGWRGGQRQVFFLHQSLLSLGIDSLAVAQERGELYRRLPDPKIPLTCRGEWDLAAAFRLARMFRQFSPDVAHAHDAHAHTLLLLASLLVRRSRPKLVVSRRVDFPIAGSRWSRWKYQSRQVGKIITVSYGIREVLIRDGISEERIRVVHSGVPIQERPREISLKVRQQLSIPPEAKIIGCVAHFADHKDHRTLLRVFQTLAEKEDNIYLLLVGDGPLYEKILAESRKMPASDRIIFTGYQEDVYPYLMNFDIFVLTSYLEGLCSSLIDSLSCGVPIVASRVGGIPELVQDGENGFLVEVGDIAGFVNAILRLLKDPLLYQTFKGNCLIRAKNFSIDSMVSKTLEIYRQL